mmetsp:Transcript_12275/g.31139  ORF Transcript_12275/g.31139 Transcript_12275/m.31139 type:complete len:242 (-) Transcript_12275:1201-1926(-)
MRDHLLQCDRLDEETGGHCRSMVAAEAGGTVRVGTAGAPHTLLVEDHIRRGVVLEEEQRTVGVAAAPRDAVLQCVEHIGSEPGETDHLRVHSHNRLLHARGGVSSPAQELVDRATRRGATCDLLRGQVPRGARPRVSVETSARALSDATALLVAAALRVRSICGLTLNGSCRTELFVLHSQATRQRPQRVHLLDQVGVFGLHRADLTVETQYQFALEKSRLNSTHVALWRRGTGHRGVARS